MTEVYSFLKMPPTYFSISIYFSFHYNLTIAGDQHEHPQRHPFEVSQESEAVVPLPPRRARGGGCICCHPGARGDQGAQHQPEPDHQGQL